MILIAKNKKAGTTPTTNTIYFENLIVKGGFNMEKTTSQLGNFTGNSDIVQAKDQYFESLKAKYKGYDLATLVRYGVLELAPDGNPICPECGNGRGKDGTGMSVTYQGGVLLLNCFKCGFKGDVFHVIAKQHNLDCKTDFPAVIDKAAEIFGDAPPSQYKPKIEKTDYKAYILNCRKNLESFVGESYRGIDCAIYRNFECGYDQSKKRFIIPTSYTHYLERYVGDGEVKSPKKHTGTKEIFASKQVIEQGYKVVFIVEGEFDAMSFWQIDYPAISFSGSDISKHQQKLFKVFDNDVKFVICYDNDDTGKLKAPKVQGIIQSLGYQVACAELTDKYNDANEFLQADSESFKNRVAEMVAEYTEHFKNQKLPVVIPESPSQTSQNATGTFKTGELELTIPKDFFMTEYGVFGLKNDRKFEILDVAVYPCEIYHTAKHTDSKVNLAVFDKKRGDWRKILVTRADLAEPRKLSPILASHGLNVHCGNIKAISIFLIQTIALNTEIIPEIITTQQTGWHDDDQEFVYPEISGKYEIDNGFDYSEKFCTAGNKTEWLDTLKILFADSGIVVSNIACTFGAVLAAPLVKICSARSLQFALIGKSGVGKSALMKFAFSIFGNPEELKHTFNSTGNAINDLGMYYNDLPCWIDELQSADKKIHEKLQEMIYGYESGKTRARLNRDGKPKPTFNFRGTRCFTAEQHFFPNCAGQGAMARLVQFRCTSDFIPDSLAQRLHRTARDNFGFFGFEWVEFVKAHAVEMKKMYDELQDTIQERIGSGEMKKLLPAHIQAMALMLTAYYQFLRYLSLNYNSVLPKPYDDLESLYSDMISEHLVAFISDQLPSADDTTNAHRALQILQELLTTHSKQFKKFNPASKTDPHSPKYFDETLSPALGVILDNGDVGFYPAEIQKYLVKDCGFPDAKILFAQFRDNDWLEHSNNSKRKFQKRVRLDEYPIWLYVVKKSVIAN